MHYEKEVKMKGILIFVFLFLVILLVPIISLWALNVLLVGAGVTAIVFTFKVWLAIAVLYSLPLFFNILDKG